MLKIKHFTFNPIQENTYVMYDEKGVCAIIDPGCYTEKERKELTEFISREKLQPKCLLNTHCHLDHTFGNKFVAETYGLKLHFHSLEKPVFEAGPESGTRWDLPFENYNGEIIYLKEGEIVEVGEARLLVLFTPGHSPGSVSFYCAEEKLLFSGDVLFQHSIGRTDLPGGNFDTLMKSIQTCLLTLPDETVLYPGHGPQTTIGTERVNNPFLNQAAR